MLEHIMELDIPYITTLHISKIIKEDLYNCGLYEYRNIYIE